LFVAATAVSIATLAPKTSVAQSADTAAATSAGSMLRAEMMSRKAEREASSARTRRQANGLAQVPKPAASGAASPDDFNSSLETPKPGFLHPDSPGVHANVTIGSQYATGDTGYRRNNLPGSIDATAFIGFEKYTRLFAGYYQPEFYPIGFDRGVVPTYVADSATGFTSPGGRSNCQAFGPGNLNLTGLVPNCPADLHAVTFNGNKQYQNDASVKNQVLILSLQKIIYIAGLVPIVISPTYTVTKGEIGGGDDVFLTYSPQTQQVHRSHLRGSQVKSVFLSLPFANSSKLFGVYTVGPQWLLNTNGNNQTNHAQIFQVLDLRYFANDSTTLFFQPSILQAYLPNDPYPERIPTIITGFSHKIGGKNSPLFIQGLLQGGTPVNPPYGKTGRIGVIDNTCVRDYPNCVANPDPRSNIAVTFGGTKAATFELQVGLGTPSVIPL